MKTRDAIEQILMSAPDDILGIQRALEPIIHRKASLIEIQTNLNLLEKEGLVSHRNAHTGFEYYWIDDD